uniref:Uncharacterized protein n=1 Tax=Anguilla anguilla TaxID=7936 RepID=A0A0E9TD13_ANGAN
MGSPLSPVLLKVSSCFPCHCCRRLTLWGPVLCKAALLKALYK